MVSEQPAEETSKKVLLLLLLLLHVAITDALGIAVYTVVVDARGSASAAAAAVVA